MGKPLQFLYPVFTYSSTLHKALEVERKASCCELHLTRCSRAAVPDLAPSSGNVQCAKERASRHGVSTALARQLWRARCLQGRIRRGECASHPAMPVSSN